MFSSRCYFFALFFAIFLGGCIGYQRQPAPDNYTLHSHSGPLQCGIGKVALTPYKRTVMAGYGPFERVANKTFFDTRRCNYHHSFARAVVLHNGGMITNYRKDYLAYVAVDILVITDELRERVVLEFPNTDLVLCATHPHSSIGGYWEGCFPEIAMGSYDESNLGYLAKKIVVAVNQARENLQFAKIGFAEDSINDLTKNRRKDGDLVDRRFNLIHLRTLDDVPLVDMVWFAAHPTVMPSDLYEFSADFPGAFARHLEKDRPHYIAMFFQGGLADVRPSLPSRLVPNRVRDRIEKRVDKVEAIGQLLAEKVRQLTQNIQVSSQVSLSHVSVRFYLGLVNVNAIPDILLPIDIVGRIWIGGAYLPEMTYLRFTRIDNGICDTIIANFPFELSSTLTIDLRRELETHYDIACVTSLADSWYGYLLHWPSAMWPPWGPEYIESFFDPGYAESVMNYAGEVAKHIQRNIE